MITFRHAREHAWLKSCKAQDCTSLCPIKQMSSTCHVSFSVTPDTDHKHMFSLTHFIHLSNLSDGLTSAYKPYDSRPICTLRCSTAEWLINANSISHMNIRQVALQQAKPISKHQARRKLLRVFMIRVQAGRSGGNLPNPGRHLPSHAWCSPAGWQALVVN